MLAQDEGSGGNAAFQPVRLAATPDATRTAPGGRGVIMVSVRNASSIVDRYRIAVDGVPDEWYDLDKRLIALFPGAEERVTLTLHPPSGTATVAGDYAVTVRALSEDDPAAQGAVVVPLVVDAIGALTMDVLPYQCEGRAGAFRVVVVNASNAAATIDLTMRDDQEGLRFQPEPEGPLTVPAGGESAVTIAVVPTVRETIGVPHPYQIEFRGVNVGGDGGDGAPDPLLMRPAVFTFVPRYTALSLPRWIRRLPTWALRLLALLLLLLLLGTGAGLAQVLGKPAASHAAAPIQTRRPTGPLPQIKQLTVQVGPHGALLARWAVAGTTDVRLNGRAVAPSGQQAQHVTKLITLVLVARGAGGTVTQMLRVAPRPVAVALPASALTLPVIHFTARTDPRTRQVALVWSVTGAQATLLNNTPVTATAHKVITPGQTTYVLRASNGLGTVTMSIVLRRIVVRMPAIDRFDVAHQRAGQPYRLVWRTRDATTVTLNGQRVGTSGALILQSPVRSMVYRLVAGNADGQTTALIQVDVRPALAPPAGAVVLVTPRILAFALRLRKDKGKTIVTWRVHDAARVWLQGAVVPGAGEMTLPPGSSELHLRAINDVGLEDRVLRIAQPSPPSTPTRAPTIAPTATAMPIAATATARPAATATTMPTPTATDIPRPQPIATATPAATATRLAAPTRTAVPAATATRQPTATPVAVATAPHVPSATPTRQPTWTPVPPATATRRPTATPAPTATATRAPTATPSPAATPTMRPIIGVTHVDPNTSDPRFGADEASVQADVADAIGVRWTRIPFGWDIVQPRGPTSWNPFALDKNGSDRIVDGEIARGRSVAGLLVGTPRWAQQHPEQGNHSVPINIFKPWDDPQNYWGAYCRRIAAHYAGRIDDWVIWNEVSIPPNPDGTRALWTQWQGTPAEYARVLQVAYLAIHAANPHARVVMYGEPYWYDHGAYLTNIFNLLAKADPTNHYHGYFDVANVHLYVGPPSFYPIITGVRALLQSHGWGDKPIWVSETNVEPYDDPARPRPRTQFRVTMQAQAAFLVDAFASYIAAGVDRVAVYRMADGRDPTPLGLVDAAGRFRPVAYTFRFLVGLFKDATAGPGAYTPGDQLDHKSGVFKVVLTKPGERITVLWNQSGTAATYTLPAHAVRATRYDKFGAATPVTPQGGVYRFDLPGGRDYTNPYDPRIPTVGGDPVILVEPTS